MIKTISNTLIYILISARTYLLAIGENTFTSESIDLLSNLKWDASKEIWFNDNLVNVSKLGPGFWCPVNQINDITIFANGIYQMLNESDPDKKFLDYYMGSAYKSENFIWNQRGLLQVGYKSGLSVIRGAKDFVNASHWRWNSSLGEQFPVLNSAAADSVIALVMKYIKLDSCAIGFGQWQQSYASGSLLSMPWTHPVDTNQNPVAFRDENPKVTQNQRRHKLVFGPVTWLAMALDIRSWHIKQSHLYAKQIDQGKKRWALINKNININKAICAKVPEVGKECGAFKVFPPVISKAIRKIMPDFCKLSDHKLFLETWLNLIKNISLVLDLNCKHKANWSHMTFARGSCALIRAQENLKLANLYHKNKDYKKSVKSINKAALIIEKFYFGNLLEKRPFSDPVIYPVNFS